MRRMRDVPKIDRPRERLFTKGPRALTDRELIAAIIGRGTKERDVNQIAGDIMNVPKDQGCEICVDDLIGLNGIGETKACQIVAGLELGRRYLLKGEAAKITAPQDIVPLVADLLDKKQEHFLCLTLNGAGELIEKRTVTVGLLNHSPVHPREVFADAITDRAASVIFVHNHPSGNPEPSAQDLEITRQLAEAGSILGIRVLDHLIVGKKGHVSLKERGVL